MLKDLMKTERKAWNVMMNGSEEDALTDFGKEGKNYTAWCEAADAERKYREEHDLLK